MSQGKIGDGVFVPEKHEKRGYLLFLFVVAMLCITVLPIMVIVNMGRVVEIDDRRQVLDRRDTGTPVAVTVTDPNWGESHIADYTELFDLIQLMRKLPRVSGAFPGEGTDRISGTMLYADGSQRSFSISSVFRLDDQVYYDRDMAEELEHVKNQLQASLYTIPRLETFLVEDNEIFLTNATRTIQLSPDRIAAVREKVTAGEEVEDRAEAAQTVQGRVPRYTITVRGADSTDLLRMYVYGNESTLVYDVYTWYGNIMCFSSELDYLCQQWLDPAAPAG